MSRVADLAALLPRLPTVVRTLRHTRPRQARAQLHHMLFGGTAPVRLPETSWSLAVEAVGTPFLAPPDHIAWGPRGDAGVLTLLGLDLTVPIGAPDWGADAHGPLFAYHLHEQAWLRHAALEPVLRGRLLSDWIERHRAGVGWDPHPISLRLLAWGKLLLTPGALPEDPALRARLLGSMADQAETLAQGLEHRLQANHLLSNRIGVVWAGLLLDGSTSAAWRAESAALLDELASQVHADGGHEERSPMYHALILEALLDLLNLARASVAADGDLVATLRETTQRMLAALDLWTGPDGRIALFADSAWDVAATPAALFDYARRLEVTDAAPTPRAGRLDHTGYARLSRDGLDAIVSLDGPRPAHQPGHAHCDALAFELAVAGRRLVTDTGVFEYRPGPRRDRARATASHATVEIDGAEQSELWAAHRVGGRARVELLAEGSDGALVARVTGWRRAAPAHTRRFNLDGGAFEVVDEVDAADATIVSRFPIDPAWSLSATEGGLLATHADAELRVRIELPAAFAWRVERGPFHPTFHREVDRAVVVGEARGPVVATVRFVPVD